MSDSKSLPTFLTNTDLHPSFDSDIKDVHLIYDYAAQSPDGKPEKWRYEMWFQSSNRINYVRTHLLPLPAKSSHPTSFSNISSQTTGNPRRPHERTHKLSNLHIPMHPPPRTLAMQLAGRNRYNLLSGLRYQERQNNHIDRVFKGALGEC